MTFSTQVMTVSDSVYDGDPESPQQPVRKHMQHVTTQSDTILKCPVLLGILSVSHQVADSVCEACNGRTQRERLMNLAALTWKKMHHVRLVVLNRCTFSGCCESQCIPSKAVPQYSSRANTYAQRQCRGPGKQAHPFASIGFQDTSAQVQQPPVKL